MKIIYCIFHFFIFNRSEASAAAQNVVLGQQRLAQAKAQLGHSQRIASHKEIQAANAIQNSATAAAEEINRAGIKCKTVI